ncbi:MAG: oligoribonuclease [Cellvibrionaceae bacterium]
MISDSNLIWIDLEMTGLEPNKDVIIEIATLITDSDLNMLAEGPIVAIHQPNEVLSGMDEWNTNQHGKSGLTDRVKSSKFDAEAAETLTIDFLKQWVPAGKSPICGNSICQDRRFLANYMPHLEAYFHYRNLDVSSLKILAQQWNPSVADGVKKMGSHLAMDDIKDSVAELKHYKKHFLVTK